MNPAGIPAVVFADPKPFVPRHWSDPAQLLFPEDERRSSLESGKSVWRVVGGPGTGKSSLLADLAVAYIQAGVNPDEILVVAQSKDAAARMRGEISRQLVDVDGAAATTAGAGGMVRALHSLAFAVVRDAAVRRGDPEPSLTTGAKQDATVRSLLQGHAKLEGAYWPDRLKPALELQGMARGVRDFLLRAAERGQSGADLQRLGAQYGIEEWSAAGKFLEEYRQTLRLGWHTDLNAAELVTQALSELGQDEKLLERWGIKLVLIDDAQHVDPQAAQLLQAFVDRAHLAVVTGDEDQSVLHFRGASNRFLESVAEQGQTIVLHTSYRCVPEIATVANAVSTTLPKAPAQRGIRGVNTAVEYQGENELGIPARRMTIHPTQSSEYSEVANFLRRLHVEQGVSWKDMVVLVRAGAGDSPLHRALARAGVPVQVDPTDIVLGEQRLVKALLLALEAVSAPSALSDRQWEEFLKGPLVGMEPVSFARLIRGVRSTDLSGKPAIERIVDMLRSSDRTTEHMELLGALQTREKKLLEHPLELLDKGRAARKMGVELVLWELWNATGLADHLVAASLRGGAAGATADRDLDAVMALFDFAGDLAESNPRLTAAGLIQAIEEQELPIGARDRRAADRDAVSILSAHAALGREWEAVAVCGVQESVWPSLSITGSILRQEDLVALLDDGIEPGTPVSFLADRLAEERRLFHVAVSRARQHLLVTAVDNAEEVGIPSPFVLELSKKFGAERISLDSSVDAVKTAEELTEGAEASDVVVPAGRLLSVSTLLAELRAVVVDGTQTVTRRRHAAWQLARLASAGVAGAHPDSWWGLPQPSTNAPLADGGPVRVSPSKVEGTMTCPLRAKLEPYEDSAAMSLGTMFHDAAEALAKGADIADVREEIRRIYPIISTEPRWRHESEINAWLEALDSWQSWISTKKSLGSEIGVRVNLSDDIVINGRIDQLIHDDDGNVQIVDIKTAKTPVSTKEIEDHAQLATYQLALSRGEVTESHGETVIRNGAGIGQSGAYLVYPRKSAKNGLPTTREQSKFTEERLREWETKVVDVAEAIRAPHALAVVNSHCDFCKVKSSCPAMDGKR